MEVLDVYCSISVSVYGDVNGYTKNKVFVSYLNKMIEVDVPNNIKKDQYIKIKGLGHTDKNGNIGDLYLHIKNVCYDSLTKIAKNSSNSAVRKIQLKCGSCGGTMDVDENRTVLSCPYCNSKELIIESDKVKVERIRGDVETSRQQAYMNVEMNRQQTYKDIEISKQEYKLKKEAQDMKFTLIILVGAFIVMPLIFLLTMGLLNVIF